MHAEVKPAPIASPRHTLIVLAIIAAIALIGYRQMHAPPGAAAPAKSPSRLPTYLAVIALQYGWVQLVRGGMRARGRSLGELTGGMPRTARAAAVDLLLAAALYAAANGAIYAVRWLLHPPDANTSFLLPHTIPEKALWLLVSMAAGIGEEIVFRGYLQRQMHALTGSAAAAIILQAVLFGAAHAYQGLAAIALTGAYGLVLGIGARWRGNVLAAAVAHAATDIVGGLR